MMEREKILILLFLTLVLFRAGNFQLISFSGGKRVPVLQFCRECMDAVNALFESIYTSLVSGSIISHAAEPLPRTNLSTPPGIDECGNYIQPVIVRSMAIHTGNLPRAVRTAVNRVGIDDKR